jgi:hypothetical protein
MREGGCRVFHRSSFGDIGRQFMKEWNNLRCIKDVILPVIKKIFPAITLV